MGDVGTEVSYEAADELGALADAFRDLCTYVRDVAEMSERVSNGDLGMEVKPRSADDTLGHSQQEDGRQS